MDPMDESWRLGRKQDALRLRAKMIRAVRRFFYDRDYLEVETPIRIPSPAPEEHIDAPASGDWFLQTSPELCMKRLMAARYAGIFQISKCFRESERGRLHLPEFTLLEWYREGVDYQALMQECENLIRYVAQLLEKGDVLFFQGHEISLEVPWERISVEEAFARYGALSMAEALKKGCFDEMMACQIEPRLGGGPVFLYDYPVALGALARSKQSNPAVAERFELYMGGVELANAFSELNDAKEQRQRFAKALQVRRTLGKTVYPMPESFLAGLSHMPESAGIALGVDRLAMIFADAASIDEVVAFSPEML
jgi:elongation factor P--(R)-beta-lysine ligase